MSIVPGRLAAQVLRILPRKRLSRAVGWAASARVPEPLLQSFVDTFVRTYGIDLSDTVCPEEGFASFDEFFTRKLKPGARPADERADALLSPADGEVEDLGPVDQTSSILVKGQRYSVAELLKSEEDAAHFEGGHYFVVYLSPRDYHRVHAPVSGAVTHTHYVPGTLFPVNEIGVKHVPQLFARNERVVTMQQSESHGRVATIMVGAIGVGRIELCFDDVQTNVGQTPGLRRYDSLPMHLERAAELGVFHLGSTAVVFTPASQKFRVAVSAGDSVRVGQALAYGGLS